MKSGFLLLGWLLCAPLLWAQNLIPDGDFERLRDPSCVSPTQAFQFSDTWYPLDATPDLFQGGCVLDESGSFFWDAQVSAFSGSNFAGISSRWNSNATYVSEGIATRLTEPLRAGVTYYLQFAILNRGGYQGFAEDVSGCNLRPNKHLDIYLSRDSIRIENNFSNGTSSTTAQLAARMDSEVISSRVPSEDWIMVSTCFEAEGGEKYLGITMPLGTFGDLPPCALSMSNSGVFRSFYYHLDAIQLTDTPDELRAAVNFCESESLDIDLLALLDQPILEEAVFFWEDGLNGAQRNFTSGGTYRATAEVACGAIPIVIEVEALSCEPEIYVPNTFSPNRDGVNDAFAPFIQATSPVISYEWTIFSRWGSVVFQTSDPTRGWEGAWQQQVATPGLYLWKLDLEVETLDGPKWIRQTGEVLLVR
jgi:gliding motility-associated-like protein